MADTGQPIMLEVVPFTVYALRIFPLWAEEPERIELGNDLAAIIDRIVNEKSVGNLIGGEMKPMRFCLLEQEEAIRLVLAQKTYYEKRQIPIWKVMVPSSGVYSRETILSCIARNAGRNVEKYENVLFNHPKAARFYTYSGNEIRPVDETVFVLEPSALPRSD
jgi:hypothetical protein